MSVPADWDDWMAAAGAEASFTQTVRWARINRAINGLAPHCVEVRRDGTRIAGALFGHRKPGSAARAALLGEGGTLECLAGPVIVADDPGALEALLDRTDALAAELRARPIFSQPPPTASWPARHDAGARFGARGYQRIAWLTALVDIARPETALLASFRHAARQGIRKCQSLGITVRECRDAEDYLENFSRPLFATRKAMGVAGFEALAERPWWDLDPERAYHYFIAADGEDVLGTLGTHRWNGLATEIMSERMMSAREKRLPVQDLLHWHAFLAHRDLGDRVFDLAGFNPDPRDDKEAGIKRFKEKWQGREVAIPRFERADTSLRGRAARALYRRLTSVIPDAD
jgi:hypothetical protein